MVKSQPVKITENKVIKKYFLFNVYTQWKSPLLGKSTVSTEAISSKICADLCMTNVTELHQHYTEPKFGCKKVNILV